MSRFKLKNRFCGIRRHPAHTPHPARRKRRGAASLRPALPLGSFARARLVAFARKIAYISPIMSDDLYSSDVLRLAANIPRIGRLAHPHASARRVSRLCGSELELDLALDGARIGDLALRVKACALGQASAAILARHGVGATPDEIVATRDQLRAMLKQNGPAPRGRFAELAALEAAKSYPARHQSILLAFDAAVEALTAARAGRETDTVTG